MSIQSEHYDCVVIGGGNGQAGRIDSNDRTFVGLECRLTCHIPGRVVTEKSCHHQSLCLLRAHDAFLGENADPLQRWLAVDPAWCAGGDPAMERRVIMVLLVKSDSPTVRHLPGRLQKQQATVGRCWKDPASS